MASIFNRHDTQGSHIGASNAVAGCMMATAATFPYLTVYFMGVVPVRLFLIVGGYFVYDMYQSNRSLTAIQQGKINNIGHVCGSLFGLFYWLRYVRR